MSHRPLVSIITPTFNRATLLAKAIESVVSQTQQSWELLIWDDGSSDQTKQLILNCGDPRVFYYGGQNNGPAFARNQALKKAKGEYIAFLDDDDQWLPGKLARQTQILERFREVDILFANFQNVDVVNGSAKLSFVANRDILGLMKTELLEPGVGLIRDRFPQTLLQRNFILPSSVMMRRRVLVAAGSFNEKLRISEDKEYWWRCALLKKRFAYVDDVLLVRRKGRDSASADGEHTRAEDIKALHCCLEDAEKAGKNELVQIARRAIGMAWEDLIKFHGGQGQKRKALKAFQRRCRFGLSLRAAALAACSLCGLWMVRPARRQSQPAPWQPAECPVARRAKS